MFLVYINGIESGTVYAPDYATAKAAARKLYGVACDVIG